MRVKDTLEALVDSLIGSLDTVTGTWKPCWTGGGSIPTNASTGNSYRGVNVLLLWASQIEHEYPTARWATYKQWSAIGGQVRKGERGTSGVKWVEVAKSEAVDGVKSKGGLIPVGFTVFNAAQQDGWEATPATPIEVTEAETRFVAAIANLSFKYAVDRPCYRPATDTVCWPDRENFHSSEGFVGTVAHELAHWSGHESRLKRDLTGRFGSDSYAAEELVAEISASLTAATFNFGELPQRDDHARYIKHWAAVLKADPSLLLTAAQAAQKATTWLVERAVPLAVAA